ncbi:MAG: hypothetical protein LBU32_17205 [Clostridiales bacterium]|jgi:hypothetical protein|nr:hypothetical protein [Clostridiales bacterium]
MEPIFKKGIIGCMYCMKEVERTMLRIQDDENSAKQISELISYVQNHQKQYADTAQAISEQLSGAVAAPEAYFTYIYDPDSTPLSVPDEGLPAEIPLGPLAQYSSPDSTSVHMRYKDDAGITQTLVYDTKVCPYCRKRLYSQAGKIDMYAVSIFGVRNIGKTQFIKTLIRMASEDDVFSGSGFSLSLDGFSSNQMAFIDTYGTVPPTPDRLENEDNYYYFILSWTTEGKTEKACIAFIDTPGERMLKAATAARRVELIKKLVKTNIVLFFSDPTLTSNFIKRLNALIDRDADLNKKPECMFYFNPQTLVDLKVAKLNARRGRQENSFEETVSLFAEGLGKVRVSKSLNVAVVYTKLDYIEFFQKNYSFYSGADFDGGVKIFAENDRIFACDPPKAGSAPLNQDWLDIISRGQIFFRNEDGKSLSKLSGVLDRNESEIPCFLISNGTLQLTGKSPEEDLLRISGISTQIAGIIASVSENDGKIADLKGQIKKRQEELRELMPFRNMKSKSCLPLILWILKTLNPSHIVQALAPHPPTPAQKGMFRRFVDFVDKL